MVSFQKGGKPLQGVINSSRAESRLARSSPSRRVFFVGRAVRATPRHPWPGGPARTSVWQQAPESGHVSHITPWRPGQSLTGRFLARQRRARGGRSRLRASLLILSFNWRPDSAVRWLYREPENKYALLSHGLNLVTLNPPDLLNLCPHIRPCNQLFSFLP
jgi:hypothetical protein